MIEVHSGSRLSSVIVEAGPVGFGDGEGVAVGSVLGFIWLGVGEGVGVGVGTAVGVGARFTATPLFHTKFLPLLMQVYLTLLTVFVALTLLHFVPEIVAEKAVVVESTSARDSDPISVTRLKIALT